MSQTTTDQTHHITYTRIEDFETVLVKADGRGWLRW